MTELYQQLGFEVRLELAEVSAAESMETRSCADCFIISHARTIYTRPRVDSLRKPSSALENT